MSDLTVRFISSVAMIGLALITGVGGGIVFAALWALIAFAIFCEWLAMTGVAPSRGQGLGLRLVGLVVVTFSATLISEGTYGILLVIFFTGLALLAVTAPRHKKVWVMLGLIYACALAASVCLVRNSGHAYGLMALLWLFAVVWSADVCAYFGGRLIGGARLAPHISPGKTWAGFFSSLLGGCLGGLIAVFELGPFLVAGKETFLSIPIALLSFATAFVAQCGDLLESALKRHFHVKDAGTLIPGHGGLMDRLDSFLAACCFVVVIGCVHESFAPTRDDKSLFRHPRGQNDVLQTGQSWMPVFPLMDEGPPNVPDIGRGVLRW